MNVVRCGGRGWDCNQFLVKDGKTNAFDLVDAGHGMDFEAVLGEIAAVTDPHRIRRVYVTHEHLDHVNGLPAFQKLGAAIVASPACADKLAAGHDPTSAQFGMDIPTLEVDEVLADGAQVPMGDAHGTALLTPGHCPGSVCYHVEAEKVLFTGDTVFAHGGIGRFDFPDSNHAELAASIARLAELDAATLHCGHGPSLTTGAKENLARCLESVHRI